ncbi:MAG: triose-phosphate isomerase [Rhodospirillales bacterium]|nr:triose-phosphate isomerase [Rhodospirillales bacterium]
MKKLIAGNWKMNGNKAGALALAEGIVTAIKVDPEVADKCDFLVCPPFVHIPGVAAVLSEDVALGGQDCADVPAGAYTGDVSADMLMDCGCEYVILGHSERRQYHKESSGLIAEKAAQAHRSGLKTIICVGETEDEREEGRAEDIVGHQLRESLPSLVNAGNTVIAYEPVWAIGTGKVATVEDVQAMHRFIRGKLQERLADATEIRILYGGSVKPDNAGDLFRIENVDGALIGGASLKTDDFIGIAKAV